MMSHISSMKYKLQTLYSFKTKILPLIVGSTSESQLSENVQNTPEVRYALIENRTKITYGKVSSLNY